MKKRNGIKRFLLGCITLLFLQAPVQAQLSAAQNYARNRPGVVMVKTTFTATVYLKQVVIDNKLFNALLDSINLLENLGTRLNAEEKLDIVLKEFSNRPTVFFKNTADYRRHTQTITTSGTGFFITDDGYLVTNSHVVDEEANYIHRKFILSAFRQVTESNIKALEAAWVVTFSDQQKELLYNTFAKVYSSIQSILLENQQKNIYVLYASDTLNRQSAARTAIATLVKKGQSMPGKDVAILKIEVSKLLPTLQVAGISLPRIGDRIYVYGYPDPVTRNEYLSAESVLEPSLTAGIVSGIRKTVNGWNVVQMDAEINHGNSGGPVCNEDGDVIGIATFGSIESGSGTLAAGMNFSLPVNILKEFLDSLKIVPVQGRASLLFNKAMDDYDNEEYKDAVKKLNRLQKLNPLFPGLSSYLSDCQLKIDMGMDKTEKKIKFWMVLIGIAVLFFGLAWLRRILRKRKMKHKGQDSIHIGK
ncbi:MAG: serine protease [Chitinophagaceae bacterium]|nr:MAG: serine protease [Chitinophagaceae bacterium]